MGELKNIAKFGIGFVSGLLLGWVLFGPLKACLTEIHIAPFTLGIPPVATRIQSVVVPAWLVLAIVAIPVIAVIFGCILWGRRRAPQKRRVSQELVIHIAIFGRGSDRIREVTEAVRARVAAGERRFRVTTDLLPSLADDPCPREEKDLKVIYSYDGETRTAITHEYDWLQLPG